MVLQIEGETQACDQALQQAWQRFEPLLSELVSELPALRRSVGELKDHRFRGPVAQRMHQAARDLAWASADGFVTPMAAVAGAVAQEVMQSLVFKGVERAYVNNGGDIALYLQRGEWRIGVVTQLASALASSASGGEWVTDGQLRISADMPIRGVATSGWGGRSFSLGIADSVTVLANNATLADVAATLIANAVNVTHPAIERRRANSLRDDTDLGERWVTVDVPPLPVELVQQGLQLGLDCAYDLQARGLIQGALLCCQGQVAVTNVGECLV